MSEPSVERPLTPLLAALWSIALWFAVNLCVQVTESVRPGALGDVVNVATCEVLATSLVVFAMVRVHAREESLRALLAVRPLGMLPALLSIAAGAGLSPLFSTIDDLVSKRVPYSQEETAALQKLLAVPTQGARVALVVAMAVVIPIAREAFFRGALYGGLRRAAGARFAILGTAVFFAFSSFDVRTLPTTLALGLALAWLRERAGSVLAPVLAHVAFWSVEGWPILRGQDPSASVAYPQRWIVGGAAIALLALAGIGAGRREEA